MRIRSRGKVEAQGAAPLVAQLGKPQQGTLRIAICFRLSALSNLLRSSSGQVSPTDQLVVGLNGSALLSPLTGIGQYTKSLAEHLIASGEIDLNIFYLARWSKEIRTEPFASLGRIITFIKNVVPLTYIVSIAFQVLN